MSSSKRKPFTEAQKDVRNRWISALFSGTFRRGKNALRSSDNCYDPIGILCNVIDPNGWVQADPKSNFGFHRKDITEFAPRTITRLAGLSESDVEAINTLNDFYNLDFYGVACKIRADNFSTRNDDDEYDENDNDYDDDEGSYDELIHTHLLLM